MARWTKAVSWVDWDCLRCPGVNGVISVVIIVLPSSRGSNSLQFSFEHNEISHLIVRALFTVTFNLHLFKIPLVGSL